MTVAENIVVLEFVTIKKIDESLMENTFQKGAEINVNELLKIKEVNESFCLPNKYAVLAISGEFSTITKEARELMASREFVKSTVAKAIVVQYLGQKLMGNFYLNVNKPHINTKIFTDREKAIEWLYLQLKTVE